MGTLTRNDCLKIGGRLFQTTHIVQVDLQTTILKNKVLAPSKYGYASLKQAATCLSLNLKGYLFAALT